MRGAKRFRESGIAQLLRSGIPDFRFKLGDEYQPLESCMEASEP
jgi:hypothetical protein